MSNVPSQPGARPGEGGPFDIAAAVAEFHKAFGLSLRDTPSADIEPRLAALRVALVEEEVREFVTASEDGDLVGIADALADIAYVVFGTALTYGIDLNAVLREVHRSNMSKLDSDGKPHFRDDGKVVRAVLPARHRGRPGGVTPATNSWVTSCSAS